MYLLKLSFKEKIPKNKDCLMRGLKTLKTSVKQFPSIYIGTETKEVSENTLQGYHLERSVEIFNFKVCKDIKFQFCTEHQT